MSRNIFEHQKCQAGLDCKGPGCRKHSGKTAANAGRPHPNRTNFGAEKAPQDAKKKGTK